MSDPHMNDRDFLRGCIIACLAAPQTPQTALAYAIETVKLEAALYGEKLEDTGLMDPDSVDNLDLWPNG